MSTNSPAPGAGPQWQQPQYPPQPSQPGQGVPQQPMAPQAQPSSQSQHQYPGEPSSPVFGQSWQSYPTIPQQAQPGRKRNVGLVVGLVLVAVLVLGGGGTAAWLLIGADKDADPLWTAPIVASPMTDLASNLVEVEGVWFTDEAVVQATADGVKAYDKESGKQLWATGLPGSGNVPCLAPAESYGGIGVVAYRAWMPDGSPGICDRVAAYDLGSGKELWHKRFKVEDELDTTELSVARAGDVVIVRTELEHAALKASDGSVAWDVRAAVTKDCGEGRYTGGENLIRLRRCGVGDPFEDGRGWDEISLIDPTTGKAEWTRRVEKEGAELVVSSAPIVVESGERDWYPLDEKDGKVGHEFDGSPDSYASSLDDQGSPWRRMTRVGDIFVIAGGHPGDGPDSPGGGRQSMAAYDLNTGEQLWKSDPEQVIDFYPVGAGDAGKLLAYKTDGHEQPELVEVDARSGDETTVLRYPEELAERTGALPGVFRDGDQVYVASIEVGGVSGSYGLAALPTKEQ